MPLQKLQFKPGVNKETTSYTNEGGWFDVDKVRFRFGLPEKIGGWLKKSTNSFLGTCRALHPWVSLNLDKFIGLGCDAKYYIEQSGVYYDITPIRTNAATGITFAATNGSSILTVTHTNHGATQGDFVIFSSVTNANGLGGQITKAILQQEYKIDDVVDANSYKIRARTVQDLSDISVNGVYTPTTVNADGSDTGNGGGTTGQYQVNSGIDTSIASNGWGVGTWGRAGWGEAATINLATDTLRIWSHDNFGEDLLMNVRNGDIYYWDATNGVSTRAVKLSDLAGSTKAPTIAKQIMVSDKDRHIIAFGCDTEGNPGVQDPLAIRFSSIESLTDWETLPTNTAGELRLGSGSEIITAQETRQQILVFTDESLYSMQFLGPPLTFGINLISENITVRGPLAAIAIEDSVFWMGRNEFYVYTGQVQKLPCTVRDYVFDDFNDLQANKVTAGLNSANSEIWWFYPSSSSDNIDRYVVYNYQEKVWYFGNLGRTAWIDRGINDFPIAASDGYLYEHENGFDDGSYDPVQPLEAHIESSQIDLGEGDRFVFMTRLVPDITFLNSSVSTPEAVFTIKTRNFPGGNYLQSDAQNVTKTSSVPVEQFTDQVFIRVRGRSFAFRVESVNQGVTWRLGTPRLEIRPDGRR
tara:strand:+ start:7533 stop:9449 length:1917 start_codon:yes stop_codon:yes gene_type:complete